MEEKVARLALDGHANSQIAEMLYVSNKTVEGHLSRVYRKLHIRSRRELASSLQGGEIASENRLQLAGSGELRI